MIPVEVTRISFYPPSKGYAVVLQEIGGANRRLPVIVGSFEAQSIALALENVDTPRPMTHDLVCSILIETNAGLSAVSITDLSDGTFFAEMKINSKSTGERTVDSRPSDAIAVALRLDAPIFVAESVMDAAGLEEDVEEEQNFDSRSRPRGLTHKILQEKLQKAIDEEEYEQAAILRDKIMELEKKG
ncbi:MAG: bifunctional nuclease domain-containing protein [Fidelibacterota bacterium]